MADNDFKFYKGRTYTRDITIPKAEWPYKITQAYFTVKENVENKAYVLQKSFFNGISLVDEDEDQVTFNILINATDTDSLEIKTNYIYDFTVKSNDLKGTAAVGILRLEGTATSTYNEKEG